MRLGGLKVVNAPGESSDTYDFNEIKIILLTFIGSQDLYLAVYTDLIPRNWEKCRITYFKCYLIRYIIIFQSFNYFSLFFSNYFMLS